MIRHSKLSPSISISLEDGRLIEFRKNRYKGEIIPLPEECKGKIRSIMFDYSYFRAQDYGIYPMAKEFGAIGKKMRISRIPNSMEITELENVKALIFDLENENSNWYLIMHHVAKEAGVTGYWDDSSLIVCVSIEYEFIIDEVMELLKKHARFNFTNAVGAGYNLVIER